MRLEFMNQKGVLNFDIEKKYPLAWHTDEKGKVVDEFYITPVKGSIELSCDIEIDTGDLKAVDLFKLARAYEKLSDAMEGRRREAVRKVAA